MFRGADRVTEGASSYDFDEHWATDAGGHHAFHALDVFVDGVCAALGASRNEAVIGGLLAQGRSWSMVVVRTTSPAPAERSSRSTQQLDLRATWMPFFVLSGMLDDMREWLAAFQTPYGSGCAEVSL